MTSDIVLIYATFPDEEAAREVAGVLVGERLAACVNFWPGMRSVYRWQGQMEEAGEVVFIAKTTAENAAKVRGRIAELHPYDEPAMVDIAARGGAESYLGWIRAETSGG
ncbi:divalent-cation tolerance protein CutA [Rhizobiales bacterium]|uniref:divalent-cation tolerance protein CutA n=1 Tax=Hongsoonwoonella zoysiae TaxID=2821844 RepID=UPI001560CFD8|nr:divalent-cation tolerance protein CutA [Hongsoonwoonella zoysiae]NRG18163.1 divalent-cation tolerance protein CutA [Hongsoonwoonella zoysiae]